MGDKTNSVEDPHAENKERWRVALNKVLQRYEMSGGSQSEGHESQDNVLLTANELIKTLTSLTSLAQYLIFLDVITDKFIQHFQETPYNTKNLKQCGNGYLNIVIAVQRYFLAYDQSLMTGEESSVTKADLARDYVQNLQSINPEQLEDHTASQIQSRFTRSLMQIPNQTRTRAWERARFLWKRVKTATSEPPATAAASSSSSSRATPPPPQKSPRQKLGQLPLALRTGFYNKEEKVEEDESRQLSIEDWYKRALYRPANVSYEQKMLLFNLSLLLAATNNAFIPGEIENINEHLQELFKGEGDLNKFLTGIKGNIYNAEERFKNNEDLRNAFQALTKAAEAISRSLLYRAPSCYDLSMLQKNESDMMLVTSKEARLSRGSSFASPLLEKSPPEQTVTDEMLHHRILHWFQLTYNNMMNMPGDILDESEVEKMLKNTIVPQLHCADAWDLACAYGAMKLYNEKYGVLLSDLNTNDKISAYFSGDYLTGKPKAFVDTYNNNVTKVNQILSARLQKQDLDYLTYLPIHNEMNFSLLASTTEASASVEAQSKTPAITDEDLDKKMSESEPDDDTQEEPAASSSEHEEEASLSGTADSLSSSGGSSNIASAEKKAGSTDELTNELSLSVPTAQGIITLTPQQAPGAGGYSSNSSSSYSSSSEDELGNSPQAQSRRQPPATRRGLLTAFWDTRKTTKASANFFDRMRGNYPGFRETPVFQALRACRENVRTHKTIARYLREDSGDKVTRMKVYSIKKTRTRFSSNPEGKKKTKIADVTENSIEFAAEHMEKGCNLANALFDNARLNQAVIFVSFTENIDFTHAMDAVKRMHTGGKTIVIQGSNIAALKKPGELNNDLAIRIKQSLGSDVEITVRNTSIEVKATAPTPSQDTTDSGLTLSTSPTSSGSG